jgi:hypothetical protein
MNLFIHPRAKAMNFRNFAVAAGVGWAGISTATMAQNAAQSDATVTQIVCQKYLHA